ncbi:hypothetical protein ACFYTQ_31650 [Nocardia sp. NPDC004068]|uniref:hypothetical protein n=1 Tax=Nocardia sp. NPDC004068 TaxID=3364303 RepID=UPI003680C0AC
MRTGFITEAHVVVYCDGCGDPYTETDAGRLCFASVNQALAYITARGAGVGWVYDGDRVLCDGCIASQACAVRGHEFELPRRRLWSRAPECRVCDRCGMYETEFEMGES